MSRKRIISQMCVGAGLLIFGTPAVWGNTAPEVTSVTASQRTDGSKIVDIGYDLTDADSDPCTVTVEVSDDGGSTWDVPVVSLTGDVGEGIVPGTGKAIVWDCGADLPGAHGTNYSLRLCADDGYTAPPGMVLIPGGEFEMGDHHDGMSWCLPVHDVLIDDFYMDIYEVTNQQYADALNWAYGEGLIDNPSNHSGMVQDSTTGTFYCDTTTSSSPSRIT